MITTDVRLEGTFPLLPHEMVGVRQRVPIVNDLIPLERFDREFPLEETEIRQIGERAVLMTMTQPPRPFGFMEGLEGSHYYQETQKTDGIELTTEQTAAGVWVATFRTEQALSVSEVELYTRGLKLFSAHVDFKLRGSNQD